MTPNETPKRRRSNPFGIWPLVVGGIVLVVLCFYFPHGL